MKPIILYEATNRHNYWTFVADKAVKPTDLLHPGYWDRVSSRMRPGDQIRVDAADASWLCDLLVRSAARTEARVVMLAYHDLNKADAAARDITTLDPLEVQYKSPVLKWCVVRKSDNARLVERLDTKDAAEAWIKNPPKASAEQAA